MSTAQKRALHEAMEALDAEADQGNVNDGTHLRLSKKLKEAYDAELERPHDAQTTYLVIQTAQDPNSLAYVPRVYRGLTDRPQFLRRVMAWRVQKFPNDQSADIKANRKFVRELLDNLFCEEMLDEDTKDFSLDWFREVLEAVLEANVGLFIYLEGHLNAIDISPFHVCPCGNGTLDLNDMPRALALEPRLLWWMLNPKALDDFKYAPWEVSALQQHAFAHQVAEKCDGNVRFAHALGLRGPNDLVSINMLTNQSPNTPFLEARERTLEEPYPKAPEVKRPFGREWPWELRAE